MAQAEGRLIEVNGDAGAQQFYVVDAAKDDAAKKLVSETPGVISENMKVLSVLSPSLMTGLKERMQYHGGFPDGTAMLWLPGDPL